MFIALRDLTDVFCEQSATTGAARALLEMGVFEALPLNGQSCTATELSKSLGVDRVLLGGLNCLCTMSTT